MFCSWRGRARGNGVAAELFTSQVIPYRHGSYSIASKDVTQWRKWLKIDEDKT
jgi:hypothetical protein